MHPQAKHAPIIPPTLFSPTWETVAVPVEQPREHVPSGNGSVQYGQILYRPEAAGLHEKHRFFSRSYADWGTYQHPNAEAPHVEVRMQHPDPRELRAMVYNRFEEDALSHRMDMVAHQMRKRDSEAWRRISDHLP